MAANGLSVPLYPPKQAKSDIMYMVQMESMDRHVIYSSRYSFEGGLYGRADSNWTFLQLLVEAHDDHRPRWEAGQITEATRNPTPRPERAASQTTIQTRLVWVKTLLMMANI